MNFNLSKIPLRDSKPRKHGITMVMDKGLSIRQTEDFLDISSPYVDVVKFGFGTSFVTPKLKEKLKVYSDAGIATYFGGTLFEAFAIRNELDKYIDIIKEYDLKYVEVSDGSMSIDHKEKCKYIEMLAKHVTVLSEVGSKDAKNIMAPYQWIELMQAELNAGSSYVIGEARESGTVGIYRGDGEVREGLVREILTKIPEEKIIWEAPLKAQQVYFLKLVGANVNLGNIAPSEVISLEATRVGLRGDTFDFYL